MLRAARDWPGLNPALFVTGSHLSRRHGRTLDHICRAGWEPTACVEIVETVDTPLAVTRATGRAVVGLAEAFSANTLDWVVVTGDRYESFAAGVAATMLGLPLAHVAGGETDVATNQDCNLRNALTKLAQVHFVAHETARARVLSLGEEDWRVHVVGLPSLDEIALAAAPQTAPLDAGLVPPHTDFLLVSYLPVTLRPTEATKHLDALLAALARCEGMHKLFVLSNADAGGAELDRRIRAWAAGRHDVTLAPALEPDVFLAAIRDCRCFVGNSSSGVIETPAFGTPAVIVGSRQDGRPRAANVLDVPDPTAAALHGAIQRQCAHGRYRDVQSPWGAGGSAMRICRLLGELRGRPDLLAKRVAAPQVTV